MGGNHKYCEILDLNFSPHFNTCWKSFSELNYEMVDPLLMNYNDDFIMAIQYEPKKEVKKTIVILIFFLLIVSIWIIRF